MSPIIEICVDTLAGVGAATAAGADRIELCAALDVGGLTPSPGIIEGARALTTLPIMVMIRPRPGDFVYSDEELRAMEVDIGIARDFGADGVVFGALASDGAIDQPTVERLMANAESLDVTYHRAFDVASDPCAALDVLMACGVPRVLTSGQGRSAPEGAPLIRQLIERSAGRTVVMPGCGIRSDNVRDLTEETGAIEVHASASRAGTVERAFEPGRVTDGDEIRALRSALD